MGLSLYRLQMHGSMWMTGRPAVHIHRLLKISDTELRTKTRETMDCQLHNKEEEKFHLYQMVSKYYEEKELSTLNQYKFR